MNLPSDKHLSPEEKRVIEARERLLNASERMQPTYLMSRFPWQTLGFALIAGMLLSRGGPKSAALLAAPKKTGLAMMAAKLLKH